MFRDEEYARPRAVLEDAGIRVVTASASAGPCTGKLGLVADADLSLTEAAESDWDAVVFIGGAGAAGFFDDPTAHSLARTTLTHRRPVAAICIAPSILARAGLLAGIKATALPSQLGELVTHGALWTGADVTVDGLIVTANGPDAATEFGRAIVSLMDSSKGA
jgi:protease I